MGCFKALILQRFKISFYVNKSAQPHVDKWLEFLISRRVKSVDLNFKCWEERDMVVVFEEFLRESRMSESPRTDYILAKSLKKLYLNHLKVRGEDIELFLHSFPLLEELFIRYAVFTSSDFEVCGLKLKRLKIFGCSGGKSVKVSAPNLKWIKYDDTLTKLLFEDVPKIVEAKFSIRSLKFVAQHFAYAGSCCISQLQTLSICLHYRKVILVKKFVEMPNLKKLTVTYLGAYNQTLLPLTTLLWASPRLKEFKLKFIGYVDDDAAIDEMEVNVERSSHKHLRVFEFQGSCSGIGDEMVEVVKYISDNCVPLEKIVIAGRVLGEIIHGNPPHSASEIEADELQSDRDYVKEQLQGKLPHHIHVQVFEF